MASSNGSFHLGSPAFADGALIPVIHTGEGLNLSPPLQWGGAPPGTGSYALVLDDPDAPSGPWVHWLLFNIPASQQRLPAGLERSPELPNGARHGSCWGVSTFHRLGYQGPQPPAGARRAHRYRFQLHALDGPLPLEPGCSVFELRQAMASHRLGSAELTGLYASAYPGTTARQDVQQSAAH
jgi:Raf kinase inhibitor-like YbhB/YbcL family protein